MATNTKKGKGQKDGAKASSRKLEETPPVEEKKEDISQTAIVEPPQEETPPVVEDPVPVPPSPEPIYDEPALAELIIECYEGEKSRGLYEGEGMASFTGGHEYKGDFSDGMMHGRGTYTWADGVQYEGELIQNNATGKGCYRWPDESSYEGDVVNGKRHGYGTFRCKNNQMNYSGDWCYSRRQGKGRMEFDEEGLSFYDGEWVNDIRHGWGTRQYSSGNIYQGMWFNNVRHGEGTMRWLDRDQVYTGQWEDGIQHGMGRHIWFLQRVCGSQYPLRNMYDGDFVRGKRHGTGTFYYANGSRYEGSWVNNMKHGTGKFVFKNGRVYEGVFEKDHIVEFPSFTMDGVTTPDLTQIRTRTPLPMENMSVHSNDSRNTIGPTFQLDIEHLLAEFTEGDREEQGAQTMFVLMRYMGGLRKVYSFYSTLGYEESPDNTYIMNRMQFWRFLKDCRLHHHELTLVEMDRALMKDPNQKHDIHNPYGKLLFREFLNQLVILAYVLYQEKHEGSSPVIPWCLSQLITDHVLRYACSVKGFFYFESRRSTNALVHLDQTYQIYQSYCSPSKSTPHDLSLTMRQFLFLMKDLKLLNSDLTAKHIIDILASDNPAVGDGLGAYNMELEMTFMEFFEALVGCAQVYVTEAVVKDPTTPRPSTTMTQDQSMLSMPGSPSRGASQGGLDDEVTGHGSPQQPATSPDATVTPGLRTTSSNEAETTHKPEQQASNTTVSCSDGVTHPDSAKKVAQDGEHKKSASFVSSPSGGTEDGPTLMQSMVSVGGQSEGPDDHTIAAEDELEEEEEDVELDEATKQFNFWTHQVHIFFVRKFFPAAERMSILKALVAQRYGQCGKTMENTSSLATQVSQPV